MIIDIVRHGETDWNVQGRWQGISDIPLNNNGLQQAICLKESLVQYNYDCIYVSELKRAQQTANIIAESQNNHIIKITNKINERNFGSLEGVLIEKNKEHDFLVDHNISPEGGETIRDLIERVIDFINSLDNTNRILIVAHGGVIKAIISELFMKEYNSISPKNSCFYSILKDKNEYKMLVDNSTSHITGDTKVISPKI